MKRILLASCVALSLFGAGCAATNPPSTGGATTGSAAFSWTNFCMLDVPGAKITYMLAVAFGAKFSTRDTAAINAGFAQLDTQCALPVPVNTADALSRAAQVLASVISVIKAPGVSPAPNVIPLKARPQE